MDRQFKYVRSPYLSTAHKLGMLFWHRAHEVYYHDFWRKTNGLRSRSGETGAQLGVLKLDEPDQIEIQQEKIVTPDVLAGREPSRTAEIWIRFIVYGLVTVIAGIAYVLSPDNGGAVGIALTIVLLFVERVLDYGFDSTSLSVLVVIRRQAVGILLGVVVISAFLIVAHHCIGIGLATKPWLTGIAFLTITLFVLYLLLSRAWRGRRAICYRLRQEHSADLALSSARCWAANGGGRSS